MKPLYKGVFNWYGETNILYRHAFNKEQAFYFFCRELATKYGIDTRSVAYYFIGTDRYTLKLVEKEKPMELKIDIDNAIRPVVREICAEMIENYRKEHVFSSKAPRQGQTWTKEEDDILKDAFSDFIADHAMKSGRSFVSIRLRINKYFNEHVF